MNLKNLSLSSFGVIISILVAGCGGPRIKPTDTAKISTLKSVVTASYTCPGIKVKKKSILAVKAPDMLRFEIKGFFNEPFFMLTSRDRKVQAYFVQDNAYYEGELLDEASDSIASIMLNQTGKLKIKGGDIAFVFAKKTDGSLASAEFSSGEYKIFFAFTDPEQNKEIPDKLFELVTPKTARRISDEEINRYFSKWSK